MMAYWLPRIRDAAASLLHYSAGILELQTAMVLFNAVIRTAFTVQFVEQPVPLSIERHCLTAKG
jgi:hypothetical protein